MSNRSTSEANKAVKPTLLLVDDEPANLKMLTRVLQPHYRVLAATSGKEALAVATGSPIPDLVLLDVVMPEMDGYAVLTRLRVMPETRSIPVIFVTALDDDLNEQKGLRLGAVDYITKPIRPAIVLARVRAHLDLKTARDHLEQLVEERTKELRQSYIETVRSFSSLLESCDATLAGHAKRVADGARRVAHQMGLAEKERNDIVFAGLLSRIGSITLPRKILSKPMMSLNKEERGELMVSTLRARQLFHNIPPLADAADIIANQFEHFDGSGFPRHLVGEAIPLGARILSVVRDFDLFIEGMLDSKPHLVPDGKEYLRRKRGIYYDPVIVDLYNEMVGNAPVGARPVFEVGYVDLVEGMELAEVSFGAEVFVRDTIATKPLLLEIQELIRESDLHCTIKIRARLEPMTK